MCDDFRFIIVVDSNDQRLFTISPRKIRPCEVDVIKRICGDINIVECCRVPHLETVLVELDNDIIGDDIRDILE